MREEAVRVTVVLDSEALSGLVRNRRRFFSDMKAAARADSPVVVPAVVLAEVMNGRPSDAAVWNFLRSANTCDITDMIAARAGALRERAESVRKKKRDLTVDAIVAAIAESLAPAVIITADVDDMTLLTQGSEVRVVGV
ncbi:MAG: PIN domain-containing protein [Propionibacteriaceae bacterium]|jgi:predicted nucleic acid-binding protein|nr:PIN domain-containing protein [Propionibacteriaceae bacterium]